MIEGVIPIIVLLDVDSTLTTSSKKRERELGSSPLNPAIKQKQKQTRNELNPKKIRDVGNSNTILDEDEKQSKSPCSPNNILECLRHLEHA